LVVALLSVLSTALWAQSGPSGSATPQAAGKAQGADVLWYGKAPPGWGGTVSRMQLLAPGVGWAERGARFYWTTDNGANSRDITPPSGGLGLAERVSAFYFLDSQRGWALFIWYKDKGNESDSEKPALDLASTTDAGATWTRRPLTLPAPADYGKPAQSPHAGWDGKIAFGDSLHGWLTATVAETPNTWWSFLLATADGGHTWKQVRHAPTLEDAEGLLITPSEGWLFGSSPPSSDDGGIQVVYVTRDGGDSWQKISLAPPKEIATSDLGKTTCYVDGLPKFESVQHGFLAASCSSIRGIDRHLAAVLFATNDSGRTWNPDRMVTNMNDNEANRYGSSVVADSQWIFAASAESHPAVITKVGPRARIDASAEAGTSVERYGEARNPSFLTPVYGWVIVGDGYLKATTDGATWTDISPGPSPHVIQPHKVRRGGSIDPQSMKNSAVPIRRATVGFGLTNSKHLVFDAQFTGTIPEMQTWRDDSPYHDVSILNLNPQNLSLNLPCRQPIRGFHDHSEHRPRRFVYTNFVERTHNN
jgi:photosystem II stability/assembly factor-like uncharacterized protein